MEKLTITEFEGKTLKRHLSAIRQLQEQILSLRIQLEDHTNDLEMCWQSILRNNNMPNNFGSAIDRKTGELRFDFMEDTPTYTLRLKNDKV